MLKVSSINSNSSSNRSQNSQGPAFGTSVYQTDYVLSSILKSDKNKLLQGFNKYGKFHSVNGGQWRSHIKAEATLLKQIFEDCSKGKVGFKQNQEGFNNWHVDFTEGCKLDLEKSANGAVRNLVYSTKRVDEAFIVKITPKSTKTAKRIFEQIFKFASGNAN